MYWEYWSSKGINTVGDLYEDGVLLSYNQLLQRYNLTGRDNFWKYLQMRSCMDSLLCSLEDNQITDFMKMPLKKHKASYFYKIGTLTICSDSESLKMSWQRDLGQEFEIDRWAKIVAECGKYVREARSKFTHYKVLHRYYFTPSRLHRMKLLSDDLCWKCRIEKGTFIHCIWGCTLVRPLWEQIVSILGGWLGLEMPCCPELCLLGDKSYLPKLSKKCFL